MLRILFITYEHTIGTFSGNGVYAKSQTTSLKGLGHRVVVLSAAPDGLELVDDEEDYVRVPHSAWGSLQNSCAWKEFSDGASCSDVLEQLLDPATRRLAFDIVFTVDWHAALAWQKICKSLQHNCSSSTPLWVFLSYRMFCRDEEASEVIREAEKWAAATANQTITLSKSDQAFVHDAGWISQHHPCTFLPPGIRADAAAIPLPPDCSIVQTGGHLDEQHRQCASRQWPGVQRNLFLCCVRLSPEKQPRTFIEVAVTLSRRGVFKTYALQPLLLAPSSSPYSQEIVKEFEEQVPEGRVERTFMSAEQLADLFARTAVNFHPCVYDAYGMTVVEAAAQGAPSIMHEGDTVGATHLLSPARHESFACNLEASADVVAQQVTDILKDRTKCGRVAAHAAAAARRYDSEANAKQLLSLVQEYVSVDTIHGSGHS